MLVEEKRNSSIFLFSTCLNSSISSSIVNTIAPTIAINNKIAALINNIYNLLNNNSPIELICILLEKFQSR